ncbi:protein of unknown function [Aminobacter niigataensis]|nr:protein of unknown function [Aminobacter niigataensis]
MSNAWGAFLANGDCPQNELVCGRHFLSGECHGLNSEPKYRQPNLSKVDQIEAIAYVEIPCNL